MLKAKIGAIAGSVLIGLSMAANTLAAVKTPLQNLTEVQQAPDSGLSDQADPIVVVGNVIGIFLSLLGVIALIFIIWSGFNWMMSKGDPQKVKDAVAMMKAAVVGLIVVMASYAIASFVIEGLKTATL